jgi:hypothetical protein
MTSCNSILWNLLIILPFGHRDIISKAVKILLYETQITSSYVVLLKTCNLKLLFTKIKAQLLRRWCSSSSYFGVLPGLKYLFFAHRYLQLWAPIFSSQLFIFLEKTVDERGECASPRIGLILTYLKFGREKGDNTWTTNFKITPWGKDEKTNINFHE